MKTARDITLLIVLVLASLSFVNILMLLLDWIF